MGREWKGRWWLGEARDFSFRAVVARHYSQRGTGMPWQSYPQLFQTATGGLPYPYQRRLAEEPEWPATVGVPTGAGKTMAIFLAWLWRLRYHPDETVRAQTPRRLVYCLPMRVLVEQTRDAAAECLRKLSLAAAENDSPEGIAIHVLMGGDQDDSALLSPGGAAVLVGTQDMLLSRALNRGYGISRFRWPAAFGLLNNDCLWVFDEVQLMGTGLATSAQLAGFRERFGVFGQCRSLWMSATLQPAWLATVDHPEPVPEAALRLDERDRAEPNLARRLNARKTLRQWPGREPPTAKGYPAALAASVWGAHQAGTRTMAVVNTVARAKAIYTALRQLAEKRGRSCFGLDDTPRLILIHSRYRPPDRQRQIKELLAPPTGAGCIVIATQAVEAGVDVSASTLFTELAPWASIVQRLGRCNRYGDDAEASAIWIDLFPSGGNGAQGAAKPDAKAAPPYVLEDLLPARAQLLALEGQSVAPADLPELPLPYRADHVIRAKDLVELFDTMPDLTGNDVDVSRFIRDGTELDVTVFWRGWEGDRPPAELPEPRRDELCPAPVGEARVYAAGRSAWRWDHLDDRWVAARPPSIRPGQVLLLRASEGGYTPELGWEPDAKKAVEVVESPTAQAAEGMGGDPQTFAPRVWQPLAEHTDGVVAEVEALIRALGSGVLGVDETRALLVGARHHDWGKGHKMFQETMLAGLPDDEKERRQGIVWAKSGGRPRRHARRHLRHELASALAVLQVMANGDESPGLSEVQRNLVAYLTGAHHGRVRLAIRAVPGELRPPGGKRHALGIWDGEELPAVDLGGGVRLPPVALDLSPMEMGAGPGGRPSWLARTLALRDDPQLGPFRLAFFELLLRAADGRASAAAAKEGTANGGSI